MRTERHLGNIDLEGDHLTLYHRSIEDQLDDRANARIEIRRQVLVDLASVGARVRVSLLRRVDFNGVVLARLLMRGLALVPVVSSFIEVAIQVLELVTKVAENNGHTSP